MKNNRGYTVIELIVVIAVVGVFAFITINKASYAFSDNTGVDSNIVLQKTELIEKQAVLYAKDNEEIFENTHTTYIRVQDLINNNYLLATYSEDENFDSNQKIKLVLKDDNIEAHLEG